MSNKTEDKNYPYDEVVKHNALQHLKYAIRLSEPFASYFFNYLLGPSTVHSGFVRNNKI